MNIPTPREMNIPTPREMKQDGEKFKNFTANEMKQFLKKLTPKETEIFSLYQKYAILGITLTWEKYK